MFIHRNKKNNKINQSVIRDEFVNKLLYKLESYKESARGNSSDAEIILVSRNIRYIYSQKWKNDTVNEKYTKYKENNPKDLDIKEISFNEKTIDNNTIRKEYLNNILVIYKKYFEDNKSDITYAEIELIENAMKNVIELKSQVTNNEKSKFDDFFETFRRK